VLFLSLRAGSRDFRETNWQYYLFQSFLDHIKDMIPDQEKIVRIKGILKDHPQGLTVVDLSRYLCMNRNSVAKYVAILQASGQVELQHFGASKVVFLSQRVPLSAMLGFSSDFVLVLDNNFRIIVANDSFLDFLGMKREELAGLVFHAVSHPFFKVGSLGSCLSEEGPVGERAVEFPYLQDDKTHFFRAKVVESVFDDGTTGFTIIIEDTTHEKESEHKLTLNEARYRGIVQDQTEFIVRFDPGYRIIFTNDSFCRHLERPVEAVIGNSFLDDVLPEDRDYVKGVIQSVSLSSPSATYECRERTRHEESGWQQWTIRGIFRDTDRPSEFQGVGRDITERRRAEERISRYIREIKFLSSTVSDFMKIQSTSYLFDTVGDHLMMLYPGALAVMLYSLEPNDDEFVARAVRSGKDAGELSLDEACSIVPRITGYATDLARKTIVDLDLADLDGFNPDTGMAWSGSSTIPVMIRLCGFTHQNDLLGAALIVMKGSMTRDSETLLTTYLQQAATAMRRCSAEESSKKNEELFRSIIEFSPLPISIINGTGKFLYCNPMFSREFGFTTEDLTDIGDWFQKAFPDGPSRDRAISLWNASHEVPGVRSGQPELLVRCKDGSTREIHFHRVTLSDETEFVVFEDVTERNRSRKNDRLLASIVTSTDDAIIAKTTDGIILSWNPAAERLYGYTAGEMVGGDIRMLAPLGLVHEIDDILAKLSLGEHLDHYETRRRRKDGTVIDVSVTATPLIDESNTIIGASSIVRDITMKKAEQRLSEAEKPYQKFIESIGVGFYRSTGDQGGHFLWGNSTLARILGYSSFDDLAGLTISDLFADDDGRGRLLEELKRFGFVKNYEVFLRKGDGEKIWVRITALASFSESGTIESISGVIEDITALKQALFELESTKAIITSCDREPLERLQIIEQAFLRTEIGLAILAGDGSLKVWNDAFTRVCGIRDSEKSGTINLLSVISPEDARKVSDALARARKNGTQTVHHRVMTPHGRKDVFTQIIPIGEPSGSDLAALLTMRSDDDLNKKKKSVFR
jgi:PAS domain S-box-containing protein